MSLALAYLLLSGAAAGAAAPNQDADYQRCRARADIDACYDAIRWNPTDPKLLTALGDAFARANRPADALRIYKRAATLAPADRELFAKLRALEGKPSAKRSLGSAHAETAKHYSNSAPQSQSH